MSFLPDFLRVPVERLLDSPEMFHAAAVHLPVALAVIGLPLALLALLPTKAARPVRFAAAACYALLILSAVLATRSGENVLDLVPNTLPAFVWADVNQHESMADKVWMFAAATSVLFVLSLLKHVAVRRTAAAFAATASVATLAWVIQVGHHGGTLVYEHGLGTPPLFVETHRYANGAEGLLEKDEDPVLSDASGDTPAAPTSQSADAVIQEARLRTVSYLQDVRPILQEYCTDCHSPIEFEGKLDLTTLDGILTGGEKGGSALRIGAPEESPILLYVRGERQPQMPKEESPLSEEKVRVLEQWIAVSTLESLEKDFGQQATDQNKILAQADGASGQLRPDSIAFILPALTKMEKRLSADRDASDDTTPPHEPTLDEAVGQFEVEYHERLALIKRARRGLPAGSSGSTTEPAQAPGNLAGTVADDLSRPNAEQLLQLKKLRTAMLAEHAPSMTRAPASQRAESGLYPLRGYDAYRRLRRDLRKQWLPTPPAVSESGQSANPIDGFINAKLEREGLDTDLEPCDDSAFLRRAYLDVVGVIPTAQQARRFLSDSSPGKRETLIDNLLAQNEEYAANWVPFWEDALCSTHRNPNLPGFGKHGDYRSWIFESFKENKPYDVWVSELLDPLTEEHPDSYVLRHDQTDILQSAANTAQVFLGTSMKCAACHNHFSNPEWTQTRFYGFASFFDEKDMEIVRCEKPTGRIAPASFAWDIPGETVGAPTGEFAGLDYRMSRLAALLTDPTNPRFATTIVNRLWKRFVGVGLFEPADDIHLDTLVSHPDLLNWLANDFIEHDYDIKYAIRQLMMSDTYQRAYRYEFEDEFSLNDPRRPRYYRSPALRKLWAEQLLDSANLAMGVPWWGFARTYWEDDVSPLMAALGRPTSRDEVSTDRAGDAGIVMALELLNSPEFYRRIYHSPRVRQLSNAWTNGVPLETLVEESYLIVLSRRPTKAERDLAVAFLTPDPDEIAVIKQERLGDMLWALIASPEFQYIR